MPQLPCSGARASSSRRPPMRPASLRVSTPPPLSTATPAESYPRYSKRLKPSTKTETASLGPTYPTIPHTAQVLPRLRSSNGSPVIARPNRVSWARVSSRSEEHTSELQSRSDIVCRLLLEKKKNKQIISTAPCSRAHSCTRHLPTSAAPA